MRIVILHHAVTDDSPADERDVLSQSRAVAEAVASLGHEPVAVACDLDLAALRRTLADIRPDLVFNLVESLDGRGRLIHLVPFLLDSLGIAYTGAPAEAVYATSGKITAKERMDQNGSRMGVFTPGWVGPFSLIRSGRIRYNPSEKPVQRLWIIKSVWEHASFGLADDAVIAVDCLGDIIQALADRAERLGGDCFAEWYIPGREFNLSLLADDKVGADVLPPAEIVFTGYDADKPRIVGYEAKWNSDAFEYAHTVRCFDFPPEDTPQLARMRDIARHCWGLFHLSGYARVDFRLDEDGRPWVLEINANPCLSPDAGFAAALGQAGIAYDRAVERIIAAADRPNARRPDDKPQKAARVPSPVDSGPRPAGDGANFRYLVRADDARQVRELLSLTGFFSAEEIDMAVELLAEHVARGPAGGYHFVFCDDETGRLIGYTCYGPVPCTQSAYDVYWIAVRPDCQGQHRGRALMVETERLIAAAGGSRIYADTSGRPQYAGTRRFYERSGYGLRSVLPDFYAPGDDKVIFEKVLGPAVWSGSFMKYSG